LMQRFIKKNLRHKIYNNTVIINFIFFITHGKMMSLSDRRKAQLLR